jgi:hypothetical protein
MRPQISLAALGYSVAPANGACQRVVQARCGVSCAHPASQAQCSTLPSLGDGDTFAALAPTPSVASSFFEPDFFSPAPSICFIPLSWDPVIEEAALGATIDVLFGSSQEEVAGMVEQLTNRPPAVMPPCLGTPLPSVEDTQTPVTIRSEDEQLIGHELIRALSIQAFIGTSFASLQLP